MIDLHTHILPNIDDGAASREESYRIIEALYEQGVRIAVCTPHFNPAEISLEDFIKQRAYAIACIKSLKVTLLTGSETLLHEYLFHYPDITALCIQNTRYLLLELPYRKSWDKSVWEALDKLIHYYSLIPIIAHVERYPAIRRKKHMKRLLNMGCLLQLNTKSIINKKDQKRSLRYIRLGLIDVIASDCHNMQGRPPRISEAIKLIGSKLGMSHLERLMNNAEHIINGKEQKETTLFLIK